MLLLVFLFAVYEPVFWIGYNYPLVYFRLVLTEPVKTFSRAWETKNEREIK